MAAGNHEFELIERVRQAAATNAAVALGIGDDAALLRCASEAGLLVAKDVLLEGVHFDASTTPPGLIGRKALAVNLSDMAAMAGRPTTAFVGLVLPADRGAGFADNLMSGLLELAAEYDVAIAGGDTNIWNGPAVISVTLLGEPTNPGPVLRSGARPGDWLLVTGALGGSLAERHLSFVPRIREAQWLNAAVELHAMIDLSDGLASDIRHILSSSVGAVVEGAAVPVHPDVATDLPPDERLRHALSDGEDFELLIALDEKTGRSLIDNPPFDTPLAQIGEITAEPGCWLQTLKNERQPLEPTGWEHRFE